MLKKIIDKIQQKPVYGWLLFGGITAGVFVLGLLAASILNAEPRLHRFSTTEKWRSRGLNLETRYGGKTIHANTRHGERPPKQIIGVSIWAICRKMFLKRGLRWSFSGRAMLSRATILPLAATLML